MHDIDTSQLTFAVPARVVRLSSQRAADLMALATDKGAIDPAILNERAPFFFPAEISSDLIDAYSSHMTLRTLTNFMNDAKLGVALLPAHEHDDLPFGRSLDAMLENVVDPPRTRVVTDFYTVPGLKLNSVTTDDLISGIRSGLLRDVSVGFHQGEMTCDLCGRSLWSWDCPHIPGMKYEVESGGVISFKTATYAIDNAHLAEVSVVYDGATPRAEILKAEREAAEGRLRPEAARMIEQRYRVKLPAAKRSCAGVDIPQRKKGDTMTLEELLVGVRSAFDLPADADAVGALDVLQNAASDLVRLRPIETALADAQQRARTLESDLALTQARVQALEPEAADGRTYRADLVTAALAEGVRAYGDKFAQETYETMLRGASLDVVKRMRDDWALVGDTRFPGGRASTDRGEQAPGKQETAPKRSSVPDAAYAV